MARISLEIHLVSAESSMEIFLDSVSVINMNCDTLITAEKVSCVTPHAVGVNRAQ